MSYIGMFSRWRFGMRVAPPVVALLCAGVAHAEPPQPTEQGLGIRVLGGELEAADPAVVALLDSNGAFRCTGTVIAPRYVLTAAHCVLPLTNPPLASVCFGPDISHCTQTVNVIERTPNPAFNASYANDVALLTLASDAPATPVPLFPAKSDMPMPGSPIRIVGFGRAETAAEVGQKRSVSTDLQAVDASFLAYSNAVCYGDSGSPAFAKLDGSIGEYLVGVTSHILDPSCVAGDRSVRVDDVLAWVEAQINPTVAVASVSLSAATPTSAAPSPTPAAATPVTQIGHEGGCAVRAPGHSSGPPASGTSGHGLSNGPTRESAWAALAAAALAMVMTRRRRASSRHDVVRPNVAGEPPQSVVFRSRE